LYRSLEEQVLGLTAACGRGKAERLAAVGHECKVNNKWNKIKNPARAGFFIVY